MMLPMLPRAHEISTNDFKSISGFNCAECHAQACKVRQGLRSRDKFSFLRLTLEAGRIHCPNERLVAFHFATWGSMRNAPSICTASQLRLRFLE